MRRPLAHAAVLVAGLAVVATPLASASAADGYQLKPRAARFVGGDYKPVGGGNAAKASWTTAAAATGSYSIQLTKSAPTTDVSAAVIDVIGVEGLTVGQLGDLSMDVKGACTNGAPRFNLDYDSSGDGIADGTAFYGCASHVVSTTGDWVHVSVDAETADGLVLDSTWTVVDLEIVRDETGTSYVDNVGFAGQVIGEPGR
ncbi:MAG TPA: hypothetical protein VFT68_03685 [Lapillicoccus sp.]|nr:hypothetical protein [Lapillicoccus sp.]